MKHILIALLLSIAPIASAQTPGEGLSIVRQVAAENPTLPQTNNGASNHQFTKLVISRLTAAGFPCWGHVGKTRGEGQYTPTEGFPRQVGQWTITGVSHDAIFNNCQNIQVDTLANASEDAQPYGSPAQPVWNVIPREFYRPNNPWIGALSGGTSPQPSPIPAPVPTPPSVLDLTPVVARLAKIESDLANLQAQLSAVGSNVIATGQRVELVLLSSDRIVRQLLSPPDYNGRFVGLMRPTVKPVTP